MMVIGFPGGSPCLRQFMPIMVVMLTLVERALGAYRVSTARGADEALLLLARDDRIDLLITDYLMPGMTGDALVHEARTHRPTLAVLIVTGHGNVVAEAEATWWRAERHFTKPFPMEALQQAVEGLIGPPDIGP